MADDTREPTGASTAERDPSTVGVVLNPEKKPFSGAQWKKYREERERDMRPPENFNSLAGGTQNTAGGGMPEITIRNAFKDGIGWKDFAELPQRPCVRDAGLHGIATGFVFGAARAILGASVWGSCNWAVGSWFLGSAVAFQWCQFKRDRERDGVKQIREVQIERVAEKRARKEERRRLKEIELDAQYAALREKNTQLANIRENAGHGSSRPWWKVW